MRRNSLSLVTSNFHFLIKLNSGMPVLGGEKKKKHKPNKKSSPPKKPNPLYKMSEVIFTLKTELHFKSPLQFRFQFKKKMVEKGTLMLNFDLYRLLFL